MKEISKIQSEIKAIKKYREEATAKIKAERRRVEAEAAAKIEEERKKAAPKFYNLLMCMCNSKERVL